MTDEPTPGVDPSPMKAWFDRLGTSGKLLAIGGAVGVLVTFLPLVSVSMNMGGGAFPMPEGGNLPNFGGGMSIHQTAMVASRWQGSLCLLGYVAAIVLAFLLYPPKAPEPKTLIWAAAGVGVLVALLALWLLALVLSGGNTDMMGMGGFRVSPGIGAFLNVLTAAAIAAGGLLKAREENLV